MQVSSYLHQFPCSNHGSRIEVSTTVFDQQGLISERGNWNSYLGNEDADWSLQLFFDSRDLRLFIAEVKW
jgi:hypothetical protein